MPIRPARDIRRPRIPHIYVLIFVLLVFTAMLSLVVPPGTYERDAAGRAIPTTFSYLPEGEESASPPRGLGLAFAVLKAPPRGIEDAAGIIAFILILGGAFKVLEETRAYSTALRAVVRHLGRSEFIIIPLSIFLFSLGGALIGMGEGIVPFVLLYMPIARLLGFHPVVGVAVPLIGSQVGFVAAIPFSVGVAQDIVGLPPFSGWEARLVLWIAVTTLAAVYVHLQARRWGYDTETLDPDMVVSPLIKVTLSAVQIRVLVTFVAGFLIMLWGTQRHGWGVIEMGAVFLGMGLVSGAFGGLSSNRIARCFSVGARDLVPAAMLVGMARGIVVLAHDTRVLDTMLSHVVAGLEAVPGALALFLMFLFHSVLNFFIPSSTGQAILTMPVMAPLADSVGLTRQMTVLAFQLGDGFSNLIVPTSAVLMGCLEAVKVSYERWFKFVWQLQLGLLAFGLVALAVAYGVGLGP